MHLDIFRIQALAEAVGDVLDTITPVVLAAGTDSKPRQKRSHDRVGLARHEIHGQGQLMRPLVIEADLLPDLQHLIPACLTQRGCDKFQADVALSSLLATTPMLPPEKSLRPIARWH